MKQNQNRESVKNQSKKTCYASMTAAILLSLTGHTAHASVTVNTKTGNSFFVNDDDAGLYKTDGTDSARMLEDDAFKMPVGQDGSPRWKSCVSAPCPKVPTLDKAPGDKGKKAVRKLSKEEMEMFSSIKATVKLPPQIEKLKEGMLSTDSRLNSVSLATLEDAFRPVVDAVGPARQQDATNQLVSDAEEAIRLKDALYTFWNGRIQATSYSSGIEMTSCKVLEQGVKNFNQVAGYDAVNYTYKAGALSWLAGNSVCRYAGGIESTMINRIQTVLKRNTSSDSSFTIKSFQDNMPNYSNYMPSGGSGSSFGR
jgi:hypothetical protein